MKENPAHPQTIVEFREERPGDAGLMIKPNRVYINGTLVRVKQNSVEFVRGNAKEPTAVRLTIWPDQVIFHRTPLDPDK